MITNESVKFDAKEQRPRRKKPPLGKVYKKPSEIMLDGTGILVRPVHYGKIDPTACYRYSKYLVLDLYDLKAAAYRILHCDGSSATVREVGDGIDGFCYTAVLPWDRVVFVEPCE
jgi:hypothetical protein